MKLKNELIIGLIITASIALLFWGINFLKGKNIFEPGTVLIAKYQRVDGLQESSPVQINGVKVGYVESVNLMNNGSIQVELSIDNQYSIPVNSIAQIFSADLMGSKAIRIKMSKENTFCEDGDTLHSDIEADLKEEVSIQMLPLKNKAEDLMKEMQKVLETVRYVFNESTLDNLTKSFESIKQTLANLENTTYTVDTLLIEEKSRISTIFANVESISTNLKENNEEISNILSNFSSISDSLAKAEIAHTIATTNMALSNANEILAKINNGEGSVGALINNDTLYNNIQDASKNLDNLLKDIRLNPQRYLHFSAIDLGKTVYIVDDKNKLKTKRLKKKDKKKDTEEEE